jgi:PERQ amino acid-rich with GYF domain-containing protein
MFSFGFVLICRRIVVVFIIGGASAWDDNTMASKLKQLSNPPLSSSTATSNNRSAGSSGKKTKELSEDSFMKLFSLQQQQGGDSSSAGGGDSSSSSSSNKTRPNKNQQQQPQQSTDEFTKWASDRIQVIASGSVDIPTFVSFLKEVESPYEVGDYVRSYLGDGKEAKEFSREFLERRSRWKNARKEGGAGGSGRDFEDNLCRPASAINPNSNEFQEVKVSKFRSKNNNKEENLFLFFCTIGFYISY